MEEMQSNETPQMNKNWLLPVVIIVVIGGVLFFATRQKGDQTKMPTTNTPLTTEVTENNTPTEDPSVESTIISVEGGMFYYKPNEIKVKKGEKVVINFTNAEGQHDFVIDELNVRTKIISAGKSETVEFTPTTTGEFEFYCSVGNHRKMGMVGKLIVEE